MSLKEQIGDYLKSSDYTRVEDILRYYQGLSSLDALNAAVDRGKYELNRREKHDPHYRRFPKKSLAKAKKILHGINFRDVNNFMNVWSKIHRAIKGKVYRLGDLFIYDTALRIAASKSINCFPIDVFLQCGSQKGAASFNIRVDKPDQPYVKRKIFIKNSKEFNRLKKAYHIEHFLCVRKDELINLNSKSALSRTPSRKISQAK